MTMMEYRVNEKETDDRVELLIQLLKMASFINLPMKEGLCDPAGIGVPEVRVLMALAGEGALAGHDLVGITGMTPMSVSRAIVALRERHWARETVDPDNRRRRPVELTAQGEEAFGRLYEDMKTISRDLLGGLTKRQRRELGVIGDIILGNMAHWIVSRHAEMKVRT
jgi:DNA-binding MarR family transcriptional regulator